jgi:3D (Asp-Asp-Asp) domain-containing protein
MRIRFLTTTLAFLFLGIASLFAREESLLARITVYWRGESQSRACSNGARLRTGHCAVDPKRIPYGSRVFFPDAECVAVDTGPGVVARTAARACARTVAQRAAIVIDRFFESKEAALSWSDAHPHFMTVRIVQPGVEDESKNTLAELSDSERPAKAAPKRNKSALPKFDSSKLELGLPLNSVLGAVQERT